MNRSALTIGLILFGIVAVVAYLTLFTVDQTQQALVLEFGKPKREITDPGLHYKVPFIQNVEYFDKRILDLDMQAIEVQASDQKRLVVDAFTRYRIIDPRKTFQTLQGESVRSRMAPVVQKALRDVMASASFQEIVREKREALMARIRSQVNDNGNQIGLEIVDVRVKRADLPPENRDAVYKRMRADRSRDANEFRAKGAAIANEIRSTADRKATVIRAEATRDGEIMRGEGDAERNRIFAEAFNKDAEFFNFYRSMQAYEQGLKGNDTRMLLSPNSEFFRYFNDPSGKTKP